MKTYKEIKEAIEDISTKLKSLWESYYHSNTTKEEMKRLKIDIDLLKFQYKEALIALFKKVIKNKEKILLLSYDAGGDSINSVAFGYTFEEILKKHKITLDPSDVLDFLVENAGLEIYEASDGIYLGENVDIFLQKGNPLTFKVNRVQHIDSQNTTNDELYLEDEY
jgi:hypothetical protein